LAFSEDDADGENAGAAGRPSPEIYGEIAGKRNDTVCVKDVEPYPNGVIAEQYSTNPTGRSLAQVNFDDGRLPV
jgi:hypothetical protein